MVQLYQGCGEQIKYEYRKVLVEEITDNVAARILRDRDRPFRRGADAVLSAYHVA